MGPNAIFDKSFLQTLTAAEAAMFARYFEPVCVPTLFNEIVADLKLQKADRVPEAVVRALAVKMQAAHGLEPAPIPLLIEGELGGVSVPMTGKVPVFGPHVKSAEGGKYVSYDSTPQQELWAKWACGDFGPVEDALAQNWRDSIKLIDPQAIRDGWAPFVRDWLKSPSSRAEAIGRIDEILASDNLRVRVEIMRIICDLGFVDDELRGAALRFPARSPEIRLQVRFPFSLHILRVYMAYACATARGFEGIKATNRIDLQYLFFAPFCRVFVSTDRFHQRMWPAVISEADFVWGDDLKRDLAGRVARDEPYQTHPPLAAGSVVSDLWAKHMGPPPKPRSGPMPRVPQQIVDQLLATIRKMEDSPD